MIGLLLSSKKIRKLYGFVVSITHEKFRITSAVRSALLSNSEFMNKIETKDLILVRRLAWNESQGCEILLWERVHIDKFCGYKMVKYKKDTKDFDTKWPFLRLI